MATWTEQRRVSTPSRWLLALLLLAGVLLAIEAARQFATPLPAEPLAMKLSMDPNRETQLVRLPNQMQVWLTRQADGSIAAFSARSPWYRGSLVRPWDYPTTGYPEIPTFTDGDSMFLRDGTRIFGPSLRSLDRFEITQLSRDEIFLHDGSQVQLGDCSTTKYRNGDCSTPSRPMHARAQLAAPPTH